MVTLLVVGLSPPFRGEEDEYCTLAGWFLIFFCRIFTLAADIFCRKQEGSVHALLTYPDSSMERHDLSICQPTAS